MRHDETKHGLSSIAWSGGNIRMPDVNMRKQKSDIISWKHMNTDYMTLVLYIKQTHSLSAPGLGPQTGSFMLTLSTMKCCRMARFGSAKPKAVNSIRKHRSMLLASNPFSWSASILASILAELQRTCHCVGIGLLCSAVQKHNVMHSHHFALGDYGRFLNLHWVESTQTWTCQRWVFEPLTQQLAQYRKLTLWNPASILAELCNFLITMFHVFLGALTGW